MYHTSQLRAACNAALRQPSLAILHHYIQRVAPEVTQLFVLLLQQLIVYVKLLVLLVATHGVTMCLSHTTCCSFVTRVTSCLLSIVATRSIGSELCNVTAGCAVAVHQQSCTSCRGLLRLSSIVDDSTALCSCSYRC
jgi:hypothetical protein